MRMLAKFVANPDFVFDAVIIGGGINGTGIARDAALRGLQVLLLEKEDFSCGPSAWNSRMIHGGLRYLEYAEVDLVRESLREREWLLWAAPHLVKPLPFLFPCYKHNKRPAWMIAAGMVGYDILSLDKSVDHFHLLSKKRVLDEIPGLNADGLEVGALYMECQAEYAERLSVENAIGAAELGAVILNHARVDKIIIEQNQVKGVEFTDTLTGQVYRAHARVTVNAAGPWVDEVYKGLARPMPRLMGGTKGSHLVIDRFPGGPDGQALYYEAQSDRRPVLFIPWRDKYLIGSTDLRYEADLDQVVPSDEEIEYILRETNLLFPRAHLTPASVLYAYAGVRPLPYQKAGPEGSITRRHIIKDHAPEINGLISIIGGKLTTFRSLAHDAVNVMVRKLRMKARFSTTVKQPLPGARVSNYNSFAAWFEKSSGLPPETSRRLLSIYGTRSAEVLALARQDETLGRPLCPDTAAIGAEVVFALQNEMAETLTDVMMRRAMLVFEPNMGLGIDEAAARVAVQFLNWDSRRAEQEVRDYREYIARFRPKPYAAQSSVQSARLAAEQPA